MLQGSDISPSFLKGASPRKTGLLETPGTPPDLKNLKTSPSKREIPNLETIIFRFHDKTLGVLQKKGTKSNLIENS